MRSSTRPASSSWWTRVYRGEVIARPVPGAPSSTNSWCCARGWRDIPWLMAAEAIDATKGEGNVSSAVLRFHAARAATAKREVRLLSRFTGANPHVAIVGVPSLPFDVSDLEALRAIGDQLTGS